MKRKISNNAKRVSQNNRLITFQTFNWNGIPMEAARMEEKERKEDVKCKLFCFRIPTLYRCQVVGQSVWILKLNRCQCYAARATALRVLRCYVCYEVVYGIWWDHNRPWKGKMSLIYMFTFRFIFKVFCVVLTLQ